VRGYEGQVEIVLWLRQSQARAGANRRGRAWQSQAHRSRIVFNSTVRGDGL